MPHPTAWAGLVGYLRPHWKPLVGGGVLSLATTATGLALPLVVRSLIESLTEHRPISTLLVGMSGLVIANAVIGAAGHYVLERGAEAVVLDVRRALSTRLPRLRLTTVDRLEPGDLIARATSDTDRIRAVATETVVGGVTGSIALIATLSVMAVLDPVLLAITAASIGAATVIVAVVYPRIDRAAGRSRAAVGGYGARLERLFGAFRTVKASGAERIESVNLNTAAADAFDASVTASKWRAVAGNTAGMAMQAAFVVVLTVGGARVANGTIDVATLVAFLLYIYYLMPAMTAVTDAASQYAAAAPAVGRVLEAATLEVEEDSATGRSGKEPRDGRPATVEFVDVSFRYAGRLPLVHDGISFQARGGLSAVVGPSGAGKTTIFSLIERFYEPCSGRILVDGVDIGDWPLAALRASIGYVEQDAPVLSGTLRANLVLAEPDAGDKELLEVAETCRLRSWVESLPDGFDTLVGHRGIVLSGGERQRVAVARALLRRPRLLLLDEATSQLDARNERALRDTVNDLARSITVLVAAHRLSTVTSAEQILVLDSGRLTAIGSHTDLLKTSELYRELARTQFLTS